MVGDIETAEKSLKHNIDKFTTLYQVKFIQVKHICMLK